MREGEKRVKELELEKEVLRSEGAMEMREQIDKIQRTCDEKDTIIARL